MLLHSSQTTVRTKLKSAMTTEKIFGINNSFIDYLLVLLVYGMMYLLIRYPKPVLELNFKRAYVLLVLVWGPLMFVSNYVGYLIGVMSFLPWLNNFIHSFLWVGFCLSWLYYCSRERPVLEQVIFCVWTSFIVKVAEHLLLGTWTFENFLGFQSTYAYIIAMSLIDGLYPILSVWILKLVYYK
jgi:hypothetical protein